MRKESKLCKICPIKNTCDVHLIPERSDGKEPETNDPWQCRHLTCPAGVGRAKREIKKLKSNDIFFGYVYFHSEDKKSERRVSMQTGITESRQNGIWYSTGQSIHKNYCVNAKDYPFINLETGEKLNVL